MKMSEEFLLKNNACQESIEYFHEGNFDGLEYGETLKRCIREGKQDFAGWLLDFKKTEAYVRQNGKEITMSNIYQVFNPGTGNHEYCDSREKAIEKTKEIAQQILEKHNLSVVQEMHNENGDVAWVPVSYDAFISVVINN